MSKTIQYYYAMLSPYAFLGQERLVEIADRHGATIVYKPADFINRIFARTGGLKLHDRAPARQAYRLTEMKRWSQRLGIPMNVEPRHFPVPDELAARFAIAIEMRGLLTGAFSLGVLQAVWQQERNVSDSATLVSIAEGLGMDGAGLLAAAQSPETLDALERNCDEAVACGVFGSPSYVVDGEVFWGQDRLGFVDEALAR